MTGTGSAGRRGSPEATAAPISSAQLERYRLRLRQSNRAQLPGAHLVRRRGQSLDFREFRPYLPGDDIRSVDWRASRRCCRPGEYLVRTFELEAQARIVISLDTRATMRLPAAAPKLQMACWLAEAIAYIAGRSGDVVALHDLFGDGAGTVADLGHATDRARLRRVLRRLTTPRPNPSLSLDALRPILPPASIWLLVTDLYFDRDEDVRKLIARMLDAQRGARWVVVIELDSWPHEKQLLGTGPRRIEGPGVRGHEPCLDVTPGALARVEERLERRRTLVDGARAGGYDRLRWSWPAEAAPALDVLFRQRFFEDRVIRRLVMRDAAV